MANKVTIDVEARFVDNLSGEAKSASQRTEKELSKIDKKPIKPIIDLDNNKFLQKLRAAEEKARKLGHTKTAMVLHAVDKATTIIGKILNKANSIRGKVWSAQVRLRDSNALNNLRKISDAGRNIAGKTWRATVKIADYATAPLRGIRNTLFSIQTLVGGIIAGAAAKKFVLNPIDLADAYSGAKIGFSTLLGDTEGQAMMNEIDVFAKRTPFKTSGVISNVQKMMAYGWDVERVIEDMETIGDAAASTGRGDQGLESIVYALSEIRSKGKLSTQELNQLASAGIKAKAYLAEGLGYGTSDEGMKKLAADLEKGVIGANQAIDLILEGMKEFDGMMDRTATETVSGLMSTIEDTFEINIFRRWGQGLQDGARRGLGSIVKLFDDADEALSSFGDTVYELGKSISDVGAEKLENFVNRIMEITGSFEFKNASLSEKFSMLFRGAIVDPLKDWWENGGQQKTAETAGKIGEWTGEAISSGLLALFGATKVLDEDFGESTGESVAGSFLQEFLKNFDGAAITDAFVDAISNIWSALPWWGKMLVGGYGASKLGGIVGGIGNLIGGVTGTIGSLGGMIGKTGVSGIGAKGILGFLANTGYTIMGGTTALSVGGGVAAAAGAGALTAGAGLIHAGSSAYDAYKDYKKGDTQGMKANLARSGVTIAGIGGGALLGAKAGAAIGSIGGPAGTLIGAGLGTVVGWFAGDKIARNIEAAKYESEEMKEAIKDSEKSAEELAQNFEKAKWENLKSHFGDIKLSIQEIERLADQIVWGDDLGAFDKFTAATRNAEANLQSLKSASEEVDMWMWKAGLGVRFNDDEKKGIVKSFDSQINAAKSFLDNKHYEFTAAASMLVDVESEVGKSIIESGDGYYGKLKADLDQAGKELGDALTKALEDGIINADENKAIAAAQQKIADITNKIANAEQKAELELIKIKFGGGKMDADSFDKFMSTMQQTIDERMAANDKAYKASIASVWLQFEDGAINEEERDKQLQALMDGYNSTNAKLHAEIKNVELDIIGEAYSKELGEEGKKNLEKALNEAIKTGVDPIEWSDEELCKLLGIDSLGAETAANIKDMLSGVVNQLGLIPIEVDSKLVLTLQAEESLSESIIQRIEEVVPTEHQATVKMLLSGDKEILNQIDVSELAKEFGIPDSQAKTIIEKLSGEKSIENRIDVLASDFGIPDVINHTIAIKVKGSLTANGNPQMGYEAKQAILHASGFARGGIVGGSSSLEGFARGGIVGYSDGGMVRGGGRLIRVAEEGTPEMIIPLGSQRRERGIKLWEKAGEMLGVDGFFRGGRTDDGSEEMRIKPYSAGKSTAGNVQVDIGGISVTIQVDAKDNTNVVEAIKDKVHDIAEEVAGIIADSLEGRFANTPLRG